ncbi:hypothetical protein HNP84_002009 [Thermocatellispora tengchongensis]|uniref:Uncharacterized protein n=1 Tax=Thermocatellispora tengchongensis TaxID=1073253 RepID=A0A840P304_9ACTN|nr:hypothetical protein [Thermocatellispora tengchongensis]
MTERHSPQSGCSPRPHGSSRPAPRPLAVGVRCPPRRAWPCPRRWPRPSRGGCAKSRPDATVPGQRARRRAPRRMPDSAPGAVTWPLRVVTRQPHQQRWSRAGAGGPVAGEPGCEPPARNGHRTGPAEGRARYRPPDLRPAQAVAGGPRRAPPARSERENGALREDRKPERLRKDGMWGGGAREGRGRGNWAGAGASKGAVAGKRGCEPPEPSGHRTGALRKATHGTGPRTSGPPQAVAGEPGRAPPGTERA